MSLFEKIGISGKVNVDELYNNFLGLERRQQNIVATALVIAVVIVFMTPVGCLSHSLSQKRAKYDGYIKMASELEGIQNQIKNREEGFDSLKNSATNMGSDPLKQILYAATDEIGIERQKVVPTTAKTPESAVFIEFAKDVKISNISFDQTVQLLGRILAGKGAAVDVKKLSIQTDSKSQQIMKSVSFTLSMRQPKP